MRVLTNILIVVFILFFAACSKHPEIKVEYEASQAISEFTLSYIDSNKMLKDTIIKPESNTDLWHYSMMAKKGDIVYLSGHYNDINSSLRLSIKIDGKIYKEQYSVGDTVNFMIVSGVIPY